MWDPAGQTITSQTFNAAHRLVKNELRQYQANPEALREKARRLIFFGILIASIGIVLTILTEVPHFAGIGIVLGFLLYGSYREELKKVALDLVNMCIAERYGWAYDPNQDVVRWEILAQKFPGAFDKGNVNTQFFENQFWGESGTENCRVPFWSASFRYQTGDGKSKQVLQREVIALKLGRSIAYPVHLDTATPGVIFEARDIQTEWADFNKVFRIKSSDKIRDSRGVLEVLSPAVQQRFMSLWKKYHHFCFIGQDDVLIFQFNTPLFVSSHTNFLRKAELDSRDIEALDILFKDLLGIANELTRFLN